MAVNGGSPQSVYQQIESTAGFFEPAVYELLTFYSALGLQPDEFDGQFIPLTAVNPQQAKIFAIGLLPPSSNVTGRLLDRSANVRAVANVSPSGASAILGDASPSYYWAGLGAKNAGEASKTISKTADKDLNQTGLGKRFLDAQQSVIKSLQAALKQMADTPPLRMLVNPASFRVSGEKILSDGNWGRNGPIIEHWGDGQDKIEASGKVAAFYSLDAHGVGPGLNRTARQYSKSYQNFLSQWLIYKNNGGIWLPDPIDTNSSKKTNLVLAGSVYLYYDDTLYVGSFDNITITENETAPFTLEYSFAFTARATFTLDRPNDLSYGASNPINSSPVIVGGTSSAPFQQPLPTSGSSQAIPLPGDFDSEVIA